MWITPAALTMHNIVFQAQVMGQARDAILRDKFPQYLRKFFKNYFGKTGYPDWCVNALRSVGVDLLIADKEDASCWGTTGATEDCFAPGASLKKPHLGQVYSGMQIGK